MNGGSRPSKYSAYRIRTTEEKTQRARGIKNTWAYLALRLSNDSCRERDNLSARGWRSVACFRTLKLGLISAVLLARQSKRNITAECRETARIVLRFRFIPLYFSEHNLYYCADRVASVEEDQLIEYAEPRPLQFYSPRSSFLIRETTFYLKIFRRGKGDLRSTYRFPSGIFSG